MCVCGWCWLVLVDRRDWIDVRISGMQVLQVRCRVFLVTAWAGGIVAVGYDVGFVLTVVVQQVWAFMIH